MKILRPAKRDRVCGGLQSDWRGRAGAAWRAGGEPLRGVRGRKTSNDKFLQERQLQSYSIPALEAAKTTYTQMVGTFLWQKHNIPGRLVLKNKWVSVVGVWQKRA